jgi:hypothetical protein
MNKNLLDDKPRLTLVLPFLLRYFESITIENAQNPSPPNMREITTRMNVRGG